MKYTKTAILLHWVVGLLIVLMLGLGLFMSNIPKDLPKQQSIDLFNLGIYTIQLNEEITLRAFYYNLHKSIGVSVFVLILLRVFWRWTHTPPALLATLAQWEKTLAHVTHRLLYVLMLGMPVSGLLMTWYSKYGLVWFGIPVFEGRDNKALRELFSEVHEVLAMVMIGLLVLHIAAAFKHKWVDKDDTMQRMALR